MSSVLNKDDLYKLKKGNFVLSNGRYSDLKRKDGREFNYVIRKDDILYIIDINSENLLVELREDVINRESNRDVTYGPFIININQLQSYDNVIKLKNLFETSNNKLISEMKFKDGRMSNNRIDILKTIKSYTELNFDGVKNLTGLNMVIVESGILFLLKNKLLIATGGGYFKISNLGTDYLTYVLKKDNLN